MGLCYALDKWGKNNYIKLKNERKACHLLVGFEGMLATTDNHLPNYSRNILKKPPSTIIST